MPSPSPSSTLLLVPPPSRRQTEIRTIRWDGAIPPLLRPLVRAYVLGCAFSVAPRLLSLFLQHVSRRKPRRDADPQNHQPPFAESLKRILRSGLDWQRFPTFCAAIVGGSTLLEPLLRKAFRRILSGWSDKLRTRLSRWFAAFVASWLSLCMLQSKQSSGFTETTVVKSDQPPGVKPKTVRYAGRTLDLSLFAATRALDVIVGELWSRRQSRLRATNSWTKLEESISKLADPAIFSLSSALIMWNWIYEPLKLPKSYNKWIGSAAAVDGRLIQALRRIRKNEIRYGQDDSQAPLLQGMCKDYNWPLEWGDPARSIPFPCEMVHMGCGPSCERHAFTRFSRAFFWSLSTYLPLQVILVARRPNMRGLIRALVSACRSSAFLGAFITLFYYGVCLARTRAGPCLVGADTASRQKIDAGICVGSGCFLCGWSVLLESPGRRKELALFVAPRAMATLLPRRYALDKQWRESFVFALSTAIVFTCVLENKRRVRGVLGSVLRLVFEA